MPLAKLIFIGLVKTEPIFLESKGRKGQLVKFTVCIESDLPYAARQKLIDEGKADRKESFGDVYIDCLAPSGEKFDDPGSKIIKNVHKGDTVYVVANLSSGRKPQKEFFQDYGEIRANWVYGDYVYARIIHKEDIRVLKKAEPKPPKNPYKDYSKSYKYGGESLYNKKKSDDQYVSDEELIFDI